MQKNVASQKIALFFLDTATSLGKTGDATNLTGYVSKDHGTATALADTSATEMDATNAKGWYLFDLAQAETNADELLFTGKSSTAGIACVGRPITTTAANFNLQSIDASGRVDVAKIAGTTQTARDIGASVLLSAGTGTGQLDFTGGVVKANAMQWLGGTIPAVSVTGVPLVDLKYVLGTISPAAAGSVRADAVTGAVGSVTGAVGSVTGAVGSVTGNMGGNVSGSVGSVTAGVTVASNNDKTGYALTALESLITHSGTAQAGGSSSITLAAGASATDGLHVGNLIKVYGGTGAGQTRTISAYIGATKVATVGRAWAITPDSSSTYAVEAIQSPVLDSNLYVIASSVQGNVSGSVGSVAGNVGGSVASVVGLTASNLDAAVSSRSTYAGGAVASVTAGVTVSTNNDKTGYGLSAAAVQAVWDALTSTLTTAGSIGKRLADYITGDAYARIGASGAGLTALGDTRISNLDAAVSTRSTYAGADTGGTTMLLGRLTSTRAGLLDNLDVAVSTRMAASSYATPLDAVGTRAAIGLATANLDAQFTAVPGAVRTNLATELGRIDAAITSRSTYAGADTAGTTTLLSHVTGAVLLASGYTAPDNTSIIAIKAKTDNLPVSPAATGDIPTATQNADALLNRNMSAVSDTNARSPLNALRFIRNKWGVSGGTLTVTKENDTTTAWTAAVSSDPAAAPVTGSDPA